MTNLPWRMNDEREHGWYIDGDRTCYGPLPERLRYVTPTATRMPQTPRVDHRRAPQAATERRRAWRNGGTINPWGK